MVKNPKHLNIDNKTYVVAMSGMPIHGPVGQIGKLTEKGYTVVETNKKSNIRELCGIYSPSTNFNAQNTNK